MEAGGTWIQGKFVLVEFKVKWLDAIQFATASNQLSIWDAALAGSRNKDV